MLGLSQERLGAAIGLTFQQIQKYERGTNRIGASRLWELSTVLGVPVQFFFGELTAETLAQMTVITSREIVADPDGVAISAFSAASTRPETLDLMRAFDRIPVAAMRQRICELTKMIAAEFENKDPDGTS